MDEVIEENSVGSDENEEIVELRRKGVIPSRQTDPADKVDGESIKDATNQQQNIERLARSGMYMNSQDAFKFLSDQLSWIGIGTSGSAPIPDVADSMEGSNSNEKLNDKEAKEQEKCSEGTLEGNNVTNLGRAAGNLVTSMSQHVVSRISKSFSVDSSSVPQKPNQDSKTSIDSLYYSCSEGAKSVRSSTEEQTRERKDTKGDVIDSGIPLSSMHEMTNGDMLVNISEYTPDVGASMVTQIGLENGMSSMCNNTSIKSQDTATEISKVDFDADVKPIPGKEDTPEMTRPETTNIFKPRNSTTSKSLDKQPKQRLSFQQHTRSASYSHARLFRTAENSPNELVDQPSRRNKKVGNILLSRDKKKLFDVEVMVWGKGSRGQVGQGDMLDRLQPSTVHELSGCGVIKVVCGNKHSLGWEIITQDIKTP